MLQVMYVTTSIKCWPITEHYFRSAFFVNPQTLKFVFEIKQGHLRLFFLKKLDFSGIRTQIVEREGEHADHLTTTTAQTLQVAIRHIWIATDVLVPNLLVKVSNLNSFH